MLLVCGLLFSIIYSRLWQRIPPLKLNLFKGAIAITLLVLTMFLRNDFLPTITPVPLCLLLSGVVGISIGNTAFFAALNCFDLPIKNRVRKSLGEIKDFREQVDTAVRLTS